MKQFKAPGAAVVAVAQIVLMLFAANAAATTVTSPTGTVYTGEIKGETEGHGVLDNPVAKIECRVSVEGKIESHGAGSTVKGKGVGNLLEGCTNSWHKTTVASGTVEAHWTSGYNGVLTSSGATIEATRFGLTCRYVTSSTQIGIITGGNPAKLHVQAFIPFHSGSPLCGSDSTPLTGTGNVTTPTSLYLDS